MQVSTALEQNHNIYSSNKSETTSSKGLSASTFMEQVDPEIAEIFEEMSTGLDEDIKIKRAMSLSLHLSFGPMFLRFQDGDYPEAMPDSVSKAMQQQTEGWNKLDSDKDRNIYTLDWMIDHIVHKQSDDPEFEIFLRDIRASYSGEEIRKNKTRDEINDEDMELQQFKKDLTTKGSIKFLYDYNLEKIEKMVEKYKKELLENLGKNPTPEELAQISDMVEEYRKQLLEQLNDIGDSDKRSPLNISRLEHNIMNNYLTHTLEEALKYQ